MPLPLYYPDDVLRRHDAALEYAIRVQQASSQQAKRRAGNKFLTDLSCRTRVFARVLAFLRRRLPS